MTQRLPPWLVGGRADTAYLSLDAAKIVDTAAALAQRVAARFPEAGLSRIAAEVAGVARESARRAAWAAAPQWGVRAIVGTLTVLAVALVVRLSFLLRPQAAAPSTIRCWSAWR